MMTRRRSRGTTTWIPRGAAPDDPLLVPKHPASVEEAAYPGLVGLFEAAELTTTIH